MLSLPTSITDLLFLEENKPYNKVPVHFVEAYQMLRNKYKRVIKKIEFNFMYCNTSRYFNNYLKGNCINLIYICSTITATGSP